MMTLDENSSNSTALPESWVELQVKDVVVNISTTDRKIPQKLYLEKGAFPVIDQGQSYIGGYTNDESMLVDCELPVVIFGDHTKTIKHANQRFAAGADGVKVLKPLPFLEDSFSYYLLLNAAARLKSKGYARHFQDFSKLTVKIPPLPEQVRIVAKLEELFSELDRGADSLRTAQQQLKVYRHALLKNAFEGKLTGEWRAQNPDKLESAKALLERIQQERKTHFQHQLMEWKKAQQAWDVAGKIGSKPTKPKEPKSLPPLTAEALAKLTELPVGWCWCRIAEVADTGTGVTPLKSRKDFYTDGNIPWITSGALNEAYVNQASDFITETALEETNLRIYPVGTLLIAMYGEGKTRGKSAELRIEATTNQAIAAISLSEASAPVKPYLKWFLVKNYDEIRRLSSGGVQPNLNLGIVESTKFPFCSLREQEEICNVLEVCMSQADQLEKTISTSLQQAEALRQSILKKALSGQLVPQHPDDEPASVLLERIRAERSAQQPPPKKRGRNTPIRQ